jgi:hypothetical protein
VGDRHIRHAGGGVASRTLGDDGGLGDKPLVNGRLRADPTLFLTDKARKDEFGCGLSVPDSDHRGRQRALHIRGATAREPTVPVIDAVVPVGIGLLVGRWNNIVVADKCERRRWPCRCPRCRLATRDHVAGVVASNRCVGLLAEPSSDEIAGRGLVVMAWDLDERSGERNNFLAAHT